MVVVFLAGHGALDRKGKYYFGTWDIDLGSRNKTVWPTKISQAC